MHVLRCEDVGYGLTIRGVGHFLGVAIIVLVASSTLGAGVDFAEELEL